MDILRQPGRGIADFSDIEMIARAAARNRIFEPPNNERDIVVDAVEIQLHDPVDRCVLVGFEGAVKADFESGGVRARSDRAGSERTARDNDVRPDRRRLDLPEDAEVILFVDYLRHGHVSESGRGAQTETRAIAVQAQRAEGVPEHVIPEAKIHFDA